MCEIKQSDVRKILSNQNEIKEYLIGSPLHPVGMVEKQNQNELHFIKIDECLALLIPDTKANKANVVKLKKKVTRINRILYVSYGAGLVILLFFRYGWRYFIK